jgi:hypothetical protein
MKRFILPGFLAAVFLLGASCVTVKDTFTLRGTVRIYGSEPHTYAGIAGEDGKIYAVYPPEKEEELRRLQGRLIEFSLRRLEKPQGYGGLFLKDGTVTPLSWKFIEENGG